MAKHGHGPTGRDVHAPHLCLVLAALARGEEVVTHRCGHLACKVHCERASAGPTPHGHSLATQQHNKRLVWGEEGRGGQESTRPGVPLANTGTNWKGVHPVNLIICTNTYACKLIW